jgi:hypothetical protein
VLPDGAGEEIAAHSFWSITSIAPATKGVTNGTAATREEAMAKFRAAWEAARDRRSAYF